MSQYERDDKEILQALQEITPTIGFLQGVLPANRVPMEMIDALEKEGVFEFSQAEQLQMLLSDALDEWGPDKTLDVVFTLIANSILDLNLSKFDETFELDETLLGQEIQ